MLNVVSVSFCSDQTYRDVAVIAGGVTFKFHISLFGMHSNYFEKVKILLSSTLPVFICFVAINIFCLFVREILCVLVGLSKRNPPK